MNESVDNGTGRKVASQSRRRLRNGACLGIVGTLVGAGVLAASGLGLSGTAGAVAGYRVTGTGGVGLNARSDHSTSSPVRYRLAEGQAIDIACQDEGDVVNGSRIWDRLQDGAWVSDYFTSTPVYNGFSPGLPRCSAPPTTSPQPSSGRPPASARNIGYNPYRAQFSDQCTFYAEERMAHRTGMYMPVFGHAYQFADQARAGGWTVGTTPARNSVVVFPRGTFGSTVGHVGWVVEVSGNRVRIQDYNWKWSGARVTDHWVTLVAGSQFIYSDR